MKWVKRNESLSTVQQVVENNTGLTADELLNPKPDPYIKDLDEAVALTKKSIADGMPIFIVGDYDADGVFSTVILKDGLDHVCHEVNYQTPKRFSQGYGTSVEIAKDLIEKANGRKALAILVDNGIAAIEPIPMLKEAGFTVIVIDHHLPAVIDGRAVLPDADVVVDPNAVAGSEFSGYCGAALAFRFMEKLMDESTSFYGVAQKDFEQVRKTALDFYAVDAGIATVTDCMALIGPNRYLVTSSLTMLNAGHACPGVLALKEKMGGEHWTEDDYGFKIGPVINASGRLLDDGPMDCVRLLLAKKMTKEMKELVGVLYDRNEERKRLVSEAKERGEQIIKNQGLTDKNPLIIDDPDCPEGIVGIAAGQFAEEYHRACIYFTDSATPGIKKGSGRTYGSLNLKECLDYSAEYLVGYGGHAGAAGVSAKTEDLEPLQEKMHEYIVQKGFASAEDLDTEYYDLEIDVVDVPDALAETEQFAPYGEGNPRPVFKINDFKTVPNKGVYESVIGDGTSMRFNGDPANAIGFGITKKFLDAGSPREMNMLGNLSYNYYKGNRYPEIEVLDLKAKDETEKPKKENKTATVNHERRKDGSTGSMSAYTQDFLDFI